LDVAIYHCQQAVEKALKGFLTFHDEDFPKTHDLRALTTQACQFEASFSNWLVEASLLTPYAVEFRYPGVISEPSREEFDEALSAAKRMCEHILKLLPSSVQPTP
jgi:HEPN domain-containing protein